MAWRPRKSIRLGKGVRINISKKGIGGSAGIPGIFSVGVGSDGRKRASVGRGLARQEFSGGKSDSSGCGCLILILIGAAIGFVIFGR